MKTTIKNKLLKKCYYSVEITKKQYFVKKYPETLRKINEIFNENFGQNLFEDACGVDGDKLENCVRKPEEPLHKSVDLIIGIRCDAKPFLLFVELKLGAKSGKSIKKTDIWEKFNDTCSRLECISEPENQNDTIINTCIILLQEDLRGEIAGRFHRWNLDYNNGSVGAGFFQLMTEKEFHDILFS